MLAIGIAVLEHEGMEGPSRGGYGEDDLVGLARVQLEAEVLLDAGEQEGRFGRGQSQVASDGIETLTHLDAAGKRVEDGLGNLRFEVGFGCGFIRMAPGK